MRKKNNDYSEVRKEIVPVKYSKPVMTEKYYGLQDVEYLKKTKVLTDEKYDEIIKKYAEEHDLFTASMDSQDLLSFSKMATEVHKYEKIDYGDDILEDPFIKGLDSKYAPDLENNDHMYIINDIIISRYKVLRLYQALLDYNADKQHNPEMQFTDDEMKLFSVFYGTYMNKVDYENMKQDIRKIGLGGKRL